MRLKIEVVALNDIYFEKDSDVARDFIRYVYLVKTSEGEPIKQFDTRYEAEQFIKNNCEQDEQIIDTYNGLISMNKSDYIDYLINTIGWDKDEAQKYADMVF